MKEDCFNSIVDEQIYKELEKGLISGLVDGWECYVCEPDGRIRFVKEAELRNGWIMEEYSDSELQEIFAALCDHAYTEKQVLEDFKFDIYCLDENKDDETDRV